MAKNTDTSYVWSDKKRTIFGLPLSFTTYKLTGEKLMIDTGFLSRDEEEIRLYRIMDLTLKRSLGQRLFGLGTIHFCTADKSTPEFDIKSIKNSRDIKNMISDMVEAQREAKRVSSREFMDDDSDHDEF